MTTRASSIARRLVGVLGPAPAPVTLVTGPCGSGRTEVLMRIRQLLGPGDCQYVNTERVATTPERFFRSVVAESPFQGPVRTPPAVMARPRDAFDACLMFLSSACTADGRPATFLLDEALDLRTFESFPGLRLAVPELVHALESSPNRFVLATRFSHRAAKLVEGHPTRLSLMALAPMTVADVHEAVDRLPSRASGDPLDEELVRSIHALTDGRPAYVGDLLNAMAGMTGAGVQDPMGALVSALAAPSPLSSRCRFSYELRLHRARGYGALKAILDVLAEEEPLTLTAVSQRLGRTPGSTKDYLGWLEDVDLVGVERKRYRIADPILRLWIRVNTRSVPPTEDLVAREVQRYAVLRLAAAARADSAPPLAEPVQVIPAGRDAQLVGMGAGAGDASGARVRPSGIVEFD